MRGMLKAVYLRVSDSETLNFKSSKLGLEASGYLLDTWRNTNYEQASNTKEN
jgi:hypothetical protein